MPDITICTNTTCSLRESCYRFKATRNPDWQVVCKFEWYEKDGVIKCEMYWNNDEK